MGLEAISVSTYILQGLNVHVVSDENCRGGLQGIMHNNLSSRVIIALFWLACVFFLKMKELSWREGKKEEGEGKRGGGVCSSGKAGDRLMKKKVKPEMVFYVQIFVNVNYK